MEGSGALPGIPGAMMSRRGPQGSMEHRRMAWGGHKLSKISLGPTMLDPSTPCGQANPEMALQPFRAGVGQLACSRFLPPWTPHAVCL
jgi:hypothetical protein